MNSPHNKTDKMSNPQPLQQAARKQESKLTLLECCAGIETFPVKTGKILSRWTLRVEKSTINAPTIKLGIKKAWQPIQARIAPLYQSGSVDSQPSSHFLAATHFATKNRLNHRYFGTFFN